MQTERETGLLERFPDRRVRRIVERAVVVRVGPGEPRNETAVADPVRLARGFGGVLHRERADALEAVGRDRAPLGDPVVVDRARLHREPRVGDPPELETEAGIHHRDVDALGVEHLHPLVGVEPGGVAVFVVAALAEVLVALARVAEAYETTFGRHRVLDETLVEAGRLVPPQPDPPVPHRGRKVPLPEVGGLAQVPVGVDDELRRRLARAFRHAPGSARPGTGVNRVPMSSPRHRRLNPVPSPGSEESAGDR